MEHVATSGAWAAGRGDDRERKPRATPHQGRQTSASRPNLAPTCFREISRQWEWDSHCESRAGRLSPTRLDTFTNWLQAEQFSSLALTGRCLHRYSQKNYYVPSPIPRDEDVAEKKRENTSKRGKEKIIQGLPLMRHTF